MGFILKSTMLELHCSSTSSFVIIAYLLYIALFRFLFRLSYVMDRCASAMCQMSGGVVSLYQVCRRCQSPHLESCFHYLGD